MSEQRKSMSRKSMSRKSMSRKSMSRKSMSRKSIKGGGHKKSSGGGGKKSSKGEMGQGDPMARRGRDTLSFSNGDKYEGDWLAVYPDIFVRDGEGTYTCNDGVIYDGLWELDLLESGSITWPCGQKYSGDFRNGKMYGLGTYTFPGRGELSGNFVDNLPAGNVVFLDMAGMKYIGRIEPDASSVRLKMLNHLMGGFSKQDLVLPEPPKGADEDDRKPTASQSDGKNKSRKSMSKKRASKSGQRQSMKRKSSVKKK